jgi:hypothetical protein
MRVADVVSTAKYHDLRSGDVESIPRTVWDSRTPEQQQMMQFAVED